MYINSIGEEVSKDDPSAVKRFDTNSYKELPLGGRRHKKTRRGKGKPRKTRKVTRKW